MADFDLQGLLAQFQPTQEDQDAARKQAIIAASLGLLGTQKGHEMQGLGQAGLLGMQTYNNALTQQQKAAMEKMQAASMAMQLRDSQQKFQDQLEGRQITRDAFNAQAPGAQPPMQPPTPPAAPQFGMQDRGMGQDAPPQAMPSAPSLPGAMQPSQPGAMSPKQAAYQQLMNAAGIAAQRGRGDLAMQYQEQALKFAPKIFKTEEGTDPTTGKRVQVNYYDDGTHQILSDVGPAAKEAKMVDTGSVIGAVDPFTGQPIAGGGLYNKTMTPAEAAEIPFKEANLKVAQGNLGISGARLAEEQRHNKVVEGDPETIEANAQAIAAGKLAPVRVTGRGTLNAAIMDRVMAINPAYDAQAYATRLKTGNAFASGKEAQAVRSNNVALQHLDVLDKTVDALGNGNIPALNQLSNIYKTQTGQPGPTNFAATKQIVANEIVKAIIGAGGGVEDRKRASDAVSAANSLPQLKGVIGQYKVLMSGQLQGLRQQYEASGNTDFDKYLSPEAQALVGGGGSDIRSKADAILRGGK